MTEMPSPSTLTRKPLDFAWRVLVVALGFTLATMIGGAIVGALVSPVVTPYYQDPSLGLNLRIPDFGTVLLVQVGRGPVFVLTLLSLVAVLRTSRWRLALWLWLTIAVLGSWVPMLQLTEWPATLRVAHGLEITGDGLVQGVTIAWLVGSSHMN